MAMTDRRSVADRMVFREVTHDNWREFVSSRDSLNAGVVLRLVGAWSGVQRLLKRNRQTA